MEKIVLGTKNCDGTWKGQVLSSNHNGRDPDEVKRMQAKHPGEEEEMILNDRVLGAIAVTRGKVHFPTIYDGPGL